MFRWSEPKVQVNFWHHLLCGVRLSANELYKAVGHFQPNGTKHSLKKRNISCFNKWQNPIWKEITNNLENRRLVLKKNSQEPLHHYCQYSQNCSYTSTYSNFSTRNPPPPPTDTRAQYMMGAKKVHMYWENLSKCVGFFFLNKTTIPTTCVTKYYRASILIWCKFN